MHATRQPAGTLIGSWLGSLSGPDGEFALPPHMKRCKRLLPFGKKKDGKQYGSGPPPAGAASPPPVAAVDDFGSGLSTSELERLRALFDEHDTDGNELLDEKELGELLKKSVPARVGDADRLLAEFKVADLNDVSATRAAGRLETGAYHRVCRLILHMAGCYGRQLRRVCTVTHAALAFDLSISIVGLSISGF